MKLRFTRRATRNLAEIADYLRERNPEAAIRVRTAIDKSLQNLVLFPHAGRKQEVEGVREAVTRRYPYLVYCRANQVAGEIVIIDILHACANTPTHNRHSTQAQAGKNCRVIMVNKTFLPMPQHPARASNPL